MALKNFDAKQFLLQHGERVGLYAAAGVMALLLLFGLKATAVGLGSNYAKQLNDKNTKVKQQIASSSPNDDQKAEIKKIDAKLNTKVAFQSVSAAQYPAQAAWFRPVAPEESKRRNPRVLQPVEFLAQAIHTQILAYKLSDDKEKIVVVVGGKSNKSTLSNLQTNFQAFQRGGRGGPAGGGMPIGPTPGGQRGGSMPIGPTPGGQRGGSMPMGPGGAMGGMSMGPGGGMGSGAGMRQGMRPRNFTRDDASDFQTKTVKIEDLSKVPDAKPAEDIRPLRMVEVVASFPYKQELDEFRHALLFKSVGELLADSSSAPRFLGFEVERTDARPGQPENWVRIDLEHTFRPLQLETGREYEPDRPELEPVSIEGLVLPKLRQAREGQYPDLEFDLKKLGETLAKLKQERKGKVVKPPNPFKDDDGVSIFDRGGSTRPGTGGTGVNFPGATNQPGSARGGEGAFNPQDSVIPDYLLVRFFDPTVQPGMTYKYRVRIRMANPNYERKDTVGPSQAKEKELLSDPVELPESVVMPREEYYYAVDMKALEPKDREFFNAKDAAQAALTNQVPMQLQRWLETVYDPKNPSVGFPVGDWVIADRALLTRGEYTGRTVDVEVPIWNMGHDVFTLANFKSYGPRSRNNSKVPVPFGDETGAGDPILVDFQSGGQITYDRFTGTDDNDKPKYTTVKDPPANLTPANRVPLEVLLMSPDGKLIYHDGVQDIKNYKDRYTDVKKRLDEVKNQKEPSNTPKRGGSPFDPFSK